jgi:hypothetical protein
MVIRPGGEPLWRVTGDPAIFVFEACMSGNLLKQAAPGNVSMRVGFVGNSRG